MTLLKWLFKLVLLLLVFVVAGLAFLVYKVDPNQYKDDIASLVKEQTGRELTLAGDLAWRFYPSLGITAEQIALSNRVGFAPAEMVSAESVRARVRLKPLFRKRIEVDEITLIAPRVALVVNANGESNWGDLLPDEQAAPAGGDEAAGALLGGLIVEGVNIERGAFSWQDDRAGQYYLVREVNLRTGSLASGNPSAVALSAQVTGNTLPGPLGFNMETTALLSTDFSKISLTDSHLNLSLPDGQSVTSIQQLAYIVESGKLVAEGVQTSNRLGERGVQAGLAGMTFTVPDGTLEAESVDVALEDASVFGALVPSMQVPMLHLDVGNEVLRLPSYAITLGALTAAGVMEAEKLLSGVRYAGSLESNQFSLREVLQQMGVDTSSLVDKALSRVQLVGNLEGGLDTLRLSEVQAQLDDTRLNGGVEVASFTNGGYRFTLNADRLDLDEWLAKSEAAASSSAQPAAAVMALPVVGLKGLDVSGTLAVGAFKAAGLEGSDVLVEVASGGDEITVSPLQMSLYRGTMHNTLVYDLSQAAPAVRLESRLDSLEIHPFLTSMGLTERLEGMTDIRLNLSGQGADIDKLIAGLSGDMQLALRDGAIAGANIQKILLDAASSYQQFGGKDVLDGVEIGDKTEFSSFGSDWIVKDGVLSTKNIDLRAPLFRVTGRGSLDLASQALDFKLVIAVVESLEGQGGKGLSELRGEELPMKVVGSVTKPSVQLDLAALLKSRAKREIERKYFDGQKVDEEAAKAKAQEKIDEKVNEKLAEKLGIEVPKTEDGAQLKPEDLLKQEAERRLQEEKQKLQKKLQEKLNDELLDKLFKL